jgi:hypothetical protein
MKHKRGIDLLEEAEPREKFGGLSLNDLFAAREAVKAVSFGDLPEWYLVGAECTACGHNAWVDRWELERRFGKDLKVVDSQQQLVCRNCRARGGRWVLARATR